MMQRPESEPGPTTYRLDYDSGRSRTAHGFIEVGPVGLSSRLWPFWYLIEYSDGKPDLPEERVAVIEYMVCKPLSHYHQIRIGSDRKPVLIEQQI